MKEIKITVGREKYSKKNFTGEDWIRFLDYTEMAGEKPLSKEFFNARYDFISDVMRIDREVLVSADLAEVTAAFKEIEKGILTAFFGIPATMENEAPETQE